MTEDHLGLAVSGREHQLRGRLVSFPLPEHAGGTGHVDYNGQGTSTAYAGTTTELLANPLRRRGLEPGRDVFVAFSPEPIDPGNPDHQQDETPRVVSGVTSECAIRAAQVISLLRESADVRYYDPLVPALTVPGRLTPNSEPDPGTDWDLVIVHTTHPDVDYAWARKCHVLDATYQFDDAPERVVV
jgi:UDP-N-acetyl-D-mannosaminuronate dehydrogenase